MLFPGLLFKETKLFCLSSQRLVQGGPDCELIPTTSRPGTLRTGPPLAEHPPQSNREGIHPYGNGLSLT